MLPSVSMCLFHVLSPSINVWKSLILHGRPTSVITFPNFPEIPDHALFWVTIGPFFYYWIFQTLFIDILFIS